MNNPLFHFTDADGYFVTFRLDAVDYFKHDPSGKQLTVSVRIRDGLRLTIPPDDGPRFLAAMGYDIAAFSKEMIDLMHPKAETKIHYSRASVIEPDWSCKVCRMPWPSHSEKQAEHCWEKHLAQGNEKKVVQANPSFGSPN